jgi:hypothetical protein
VPDLSTGLSRNPISGVRKPRAAKERLSTPGSRGYVHAVGCELLKTLLLEAWVHKPGILRLPARSGRASRI